MAEEAKLDVSEVDQFNPSALKHVETEVKNTLPSQGCKFLYLEILGTQVNRV